MKPLIILNPNSQGGKTGELADELERVVRRHVGEVDRVHTEHPRHAVDIAEQAARDGRKAVLAVGGDGTIHEVVNGLMRARDAEVELPPIGIIGQGTGGDFRRTLGLEHRLDRYCRAVAEGKTRSVDVGRFGYRANDGSEAQDFFINILSMGMGGLVDRYVAEGGRALGGTAAYLSASVRALFKSEVGILDCVLHNGEQREELEIATRNMAICNGRFFGSGMEVAPMAEPDDGLFHVVSLGATPRATFALKSLSIYSGKHVNNPEVEVHSCDRIEVALRNDSIRQDFPLDVDGEPLGTLPIDVSLVAGAVSFFVP
jgi:YegS/Rv2252/BmrU family lipid kinase